MSVTTAIEAESAIDPRAGWRPGVGGALARLWAFGLLLVVVLSLPHLVPDPLVNVYSKAMVFGVVALSMNVLIGYAGDVSLGHQAFVGVGAFVAGYLIDQAGLPWVVGVIGAVVLGGLISLGLGAVALRVRGLYFALVTIAYGLVVEKSPFQIQALTGGGAGRPAPRPPFAEGDVAYAYVCLLVLVLAWLFDWRVTSTKAGRAIQALRDDERVAASWGIDVKGYRLLAFVLSGAVAGLAGAMYASIEQIVSPVTFGLALGLTFVLMTVVGGVGSRPGVVAGGFVFAVLPTLLDAAHKAWGEVLSRTDVVCETLPPRALQVVLGLALIGVVVERLVHAARHRLWTAVGGWVIAGGAMGFLGARLVVGGFTRSPCMWTVVTPRAEAIIGVALLLLTLIQFPGGIAEQFGPIFRWLSFKQARGDAAGSSAGHGAGGGSNVRP